MVQKEVKNMSIYGYCRISTNTQNIDRQVRNIIRAYPEILDKNIFKEAFTGTKLAERKELNKLIRKLHEGDTVVFDSASRMSRNSKEAMKLYEKLFQKGVNLVFLKEPHINSETYRKALDNQIEMRVNSGHEATNKFLNSIIESLNEYTIELAKEQIRLVFEQAQKEVDDLHQRTKEGIQTAKLAGKRIGTPKGSKLTTKKSIAAKEIIKKHNVDFGGSLTDEETIKQAGISRNSFYKYKKEIRLELQQENENVDVLEGAGNIKLRFPENWEELYPKWEREEITSKEFWKMVDVKPATFYNLMTEYRDILKKREQSKQEQEQLKNQCSFWK